MAACNLLWAGLPKEWSVLLPPGAAEFEAKIEDDPAFAKRVYSKTFYGGFGPGLPATHESAVLQYSGQMVVTLAGNSWHQTTSCGASVAEACNCFYGANDDGVRTQMSRRAAAIATAHRRANRNITLRERAEVHDLLLESYPSVFE
jgi:hypothetical protein